MKNKTKLIIWIIVAVIAIVLSGLIIYNIAVAKTYKVENPVATLNFDKYGVVKIELYPEYAPNTVANFINLINKGFFDGKTFYGKDDNSIFAVKDDEPKMSLVNKEIKSGSDEDVNYQIPGEFIASGYTDNVLKHEAGVISMIREEYSPYLGLTEQGYNSASCHFRIMTNTNRSLNGLYTAFGKVVEGFDIIEAISKLEEAPKGEGEEETASNSNITEFAEPAVITSAKVETYGVDYGVPVASEAFDYEAYLQDYFSQYSSEE